MLFNSKRSVKARLNGSTLVAVFRTSNPPLAWKFDLERNHSFTIALQGEDDDLELGVTSPKGEFFPVARFVTREEAEQAFTAVQKALMTRKSGWIRRILSWVGAATVLVLLFKLLVALTVPHDLESKITSSFTAPSLPDGVPLPADRVLQPPP